MTPEVLTTTVSERKASMRRYHGPQWPLSGAIFSEKKTVVWISVVQGLCLAVNLGMFYGRVTYISIFGASVAYIAITFRDFGEAGLMLPVF